jgi:hypothetical protein
MQRFLAYANGGLAPFDVACRLFPGARQSLGAAEKVAGAEYSAARDRSPPIALRLKIANFLRIPNISEMSSAKFRRDDKSWFATNSESVYNPRAE